MTHTNISNFRKNLFSYVNQAIDYNDVINVNTKAGNIVVMSEDDYQGLLETLYLSSVPGLKEDLVALSKAPKSEFVSEDDVEW